MIKVTLKGAYKPTQGLRGVEKATLCGRTGLSVTTWG